MIAGRAVSRRVCGRPPWRWLIFGALIFALLASAFPSGGVRAWPANDGRSPEAMPGFAITLLDLSFQSGLTALVFAADGSLWMAEVGGRILRIPDPSAPAPALEVFDAGLADFGLVLGLAFRGSELFVATTGELHRYTDGDGDGLPDAGTRELFAFNLHPGGHANNNVVLGPDGNLYFGDGSAGNSVIGDSRLQAAVLTVNFSRIDPASDLPIDAQADADRPLRKIERFASGLRNTYDLVFLPNGDLLGTDNNRDEASYPEELNHIVEGQDYGFPNSSWPWDYAENGSVAPIAYLESHSSADGLTVYTGARWCGFEGTVFVAEFGPNDESLSVGRKVVAIPLHPAGGSYLTDPAEIVDFAWNVGRPLDVAFDPAGEALYIARYAPGGGLYRVAPVDADGDGIADVCSTRDVIPPAVQFLEAPSAVPADESFDIAAAATDNAAVLSVELWIDGTLIDALADPPFRWTIEADLLLPGQHALRIVAIDLAGNTAQATRELTVERVQAGLPLAQLALVGGGGGAIAATALVLWRLSKRGPRRG